MLKLFLPLIVILTLLSNYRSEAQSRRYGSDGQMINNGSGTGSRSYNAPKSKEKVDYTTLMISNLTKQLSLDSFQSAILTKIFEEYNQDINILSAENIPTEAKSEKFKIAQTALDARIVELLTDEQKVKFAEMKDAKKNAKKKKKKETNSEEIENELF